MSKAVLVLDEIPAGCLTCPLCHCSVNYNAWTCGAAKLEMAAERGTHERRDDCPLRELPERKEADNMVAIMHDAELANRSTLQQMGYNKGWNDCLDGLEGSHGRN